MNNTPILNLPMIASSQAQKHITHNEALMIMDALVHLSIIASDQTSPPANASEGDRYVVFSPASDEWVGRENEIAIYRNNIWIFFTPLTGWTAFDKNQNLQIVWDGVQWSALSGAKNTTFEKVGINTGLDASANLSVQSDTILFSHDATSGNGTGAMQAVINKKTSTDTASLLYQSNWSGRAELGLNGNDNFSVKISNDGSVWKTAIDVESTTANIRIAERLVVGDGAHIGNGFTIAKHNPSFTMQDTTGVGNAHSSVFSWVDGNGAEKAWCGLGSNSNSKFVFLSHYNDGIGFITYGGSYPIEFLQHNNVRMRIHTNGYIGIHELAPTTPLHVNGAIRLGTVTIATLPSASNSGAGAVIFVSNESGGATLAFSDGNQWRRMQDRAVVS